MQLRLLFYLQPVGILCMILSCTNNKIETGQSMSAASLQRLYALNLLDTGEQVKQFYSNYKPEVAGNFYTNKRVVHYWFDENHADRHKVEIAFFGNIAAIDSVVNRSFPDCPYIPVTTSTGQSFQIFIDGTPRERQQFYEGMVREWKKSR